LISRAMKAALMAEARPIGNAEPPLFGAFSSETGPARVTKTRQTHIQSPVLIESEPIRL
jgi:hypothetical protein